MKVSTRCRYATLALFDIAFHGRGELTQVRLIAERQGIPPRFLEQVFQDLKRAKLVDGKRGRNGGYFLKRRPEEISLLDIILATDGPFDERTSSTSTKDQTQGPPTRNLRPVPSIIWSEVMVKIQAVYASYTLADLVTLAEQSGLNRGSAGYMYFI